ncbi:hypothetical protein AKJ37_02950 [candidate division MSBL1 archaeon SCGC-AAA259I09]|uniref:Uncharacterized protein n=1 Tax=candidate division MSBL1 archaeon SCGC-AAA259I09 TaxID=1698267 RepID=A0A133UTH5_9EURY|nr:hypothetical protein AKJ37_02950 [candidate division MSBL1 archaeon SCGC-AAA259I09]
MIHPIVRKVLGYELNPEERLLVDLLNEGATSREGAVDPARLTDEEGLVETLREREHLKKTEGGTVYLTGLGRAVANGARKTGGS